MLVGTYAHYTLLVNLYFLLALKNIPMAKKQKQILATFQKHLVWEILRQNTEFESEFGFLEG
jgi:hypothetical protein